MTRSGPYGWERDKVETRLSLARAAIELFRERGYDATTVTDIASAAGCSDRTFFRHFRTKEDVLLLDAREILTEFRAGVAELQPEVSQWEQVRSAMNTATRRLAEPSSCVKELTIASWLNEPAVAKHLSAILAELQRIIASALAEERGVDPDLDLGIQFTSRATVAGCAAAIRAHAQSQGDLHAGIEQAFGMLDRIRSAAHKVG